MDLKHVKERIKFHRHKNGFTQQSMASLMGITQSYYQKIESGETSIQLVDCITICKIFKISLDELLEFDLESGLIKSRNGKNNSKDSAESTSFKDRESLVQILNTIKEQELIIKALIANCK